MQAEASARPNARPVSHKNARTCQPQQLDFPGKQMHPRAAARMMSPPTWQQLDFGGKQMHLPVNPELASVRGRSNQSFNAQRQTGGDVQGCHFPGQQIADFGERFGIGGRFQHRLNLSSRGTHSGHSRGNQ